MSSSLIFPFIILGGALQTRGAAVRVCCVPRPVPRYRWPSQSTLVGSLRTFGLSGSSVPRPTLPATMTSQPDRSIFRMRSFKFCLLQPTRGQISFCLSQQCGRRLASSANF